MHRFFSRTIATLVAGGAFAVPAFAIASPGGVRIIVQTWTPSNPTAQSNAIVFDRPGLIADALNEGWALARKPVCDALKAEAGKPDRLAPGFSLYDMDCSMAQAGSLSVTGLSDNHLTLAYRLSHNMFKGTSTQPSVAGSYADPCVFLYYDLAATTVMHLDTLAVDKFTVAIDHVSRPDSCNTAGDIARFTATTLHFFGGPDFLAIAQQAIQSKQDISTAKLNAAVDSFVRPLRQYAGQYAAQQNWVRHGDLYFAFAPAYTPQPLPAAIAGSINMPKDRWLAGVPDCATFSVVGNVQTGPAPITNPESMSVGAPPNLDVGAVTASGAATDAGDRFVCTYTERQLPAGVPVTFRASGKSASQQRGHVLYVANVKPEGWSGTETIATFAPGKNFVASVGPQLTGFGEKANPLKIDNPGDPAESYASRVNPAILQGVDASVAQKSQIATNYRPSNPLQRVGLNPQPLPPKVADALVERGIAAFARNDFAGAAASFARAVDGNAGNAVALHDLALAHARLGEVALAQTELRRASLLARNSGDLATANASDRAIIIVSGRQ